MRFKIGDKIRIIDTPLTQEDAEDGKFCSYLGKTFTISRLETSTSNGYEIFVEELEYGFHFFTRDVACVLKNRKENII